MKIKYIGSYGELLFNSKPFICVDHNFFDYDWSYKESRVLNRGSEVSFFSKSSRKYKMKIKVKSENICSDINKMVDVFEKDILINTPGKLYFGYDYLKCFVVSSSKKKIYLEGNNVEINLDILAPYPFWVSEESFNFFPGKGINLNGKKYEYKYKYKYTKDGKGEIIKNSFIASSPALIKIYGYCENPSFSIGENIYKVFDTAENGEYIEIDQRERTVYKFFKDGSKENIFNKRGKENSIFKKFDAGNNLIVASGSFGIDIKLYHERSEPRWI